jgi:hypothetical protein
MWFVATFGNDQHLKKWPTDMSNEYREETGHSLGKRYPIKQIHEKAIKAFPLLERWGQPIDGRRRGWAELMYQESKAVVATMETLMRDYSVPSLPVHDSLVVPTSKAAVAERVLKEKYLDVIGVEPVLKLLQHQSNAGSLNFMADGPPLCSDGATLGQDYSPGQAALREQRVRIVLALKAAAYRPVSIVRGQGQVELREHRARITAVLRAAAYRPIIMSVALKRLVHARIVAALRAR